MRKYYCALVLATLCRLVLADSNDKYVLGPGDSILVQVVGLPEFANQSYRIDADGTVGLPLVGRIHAQGLTLGEFEGVLATDLKKQVLNPRVVATVTEPRPQPVSVMGQVNSPGTQQIRGRKTLFDALAGAGGLKPDAGNFVTITRLKSEGPLPLANAVEDQTNGRITATVPLKDVVNLHDGGRDVVLHANDEVTVTRANVVYVIGNVKKAGGFTLSEGRTMSALEALSLAEGPSVDASPKNARILRKKADGREQIPVNLNKILAGKTKDVQLMADDILYVPENISRRMTNRGLDTALNTITGIAIFRGF